MPYFDTGQRPCAVLDKLRLALHAAMRRDLREDASRLTVRPVCHASRRPRRSQNCSINAFETPDNSVALLQQTARYDDPDATVVSDLVANREQHLSRADQQETNVANMLCSGFDKPKVALCLHGAARSFVNKVVHSSLKTNLVDAFGGDITVFVNMKLKDARGKVGSGLFPDATWEQVVAAGEHVGSIRKRMRVVEEAYAQLPTCPAFREHLQANLTAGSKESLFSIADQVKSKQGCLELIATHEKEKKSQFDYIIMSRGDLTVYSAFKPFCMYNTKQLRRRWDWFFMGPRNPLARAVTNAYNSFYKCQEWPKLGAQQYVWSHMPDFKDDTNLPLMLTRLNQANMPDNVCEWFFSNVGGEKFQDPTDSQLCLSMTFRNRFNALP